MKLYLCDSAERRAWSEMLPEPWSRARWRVPLKPNRAPGFVLEPEGGPLPPDALILLHPEPDHHTLAAMAAQAERRGWIILTVSGGDRHGAPQPRSPHVYRCQRAVSRLDLGFKQRLQRFLTALARDPEPSFALLEPPPWPRHLVALYLLLLARARGAWLPEVAEAILPEARAEWIAHGGGAAWSPLDSEATEALKALRLTLIEAVPDATPSQLVLIGSAPEEATLRGQLRHSWLENLLLNRNHGFIGRLHAADSPARQAFERRLEPEGAFARHLASARHLSRRASRAFCPTRLLLEEPLRELLSKEARDLMGAALRGHEGAEVDAAGLEEAIDRLERELGVFTAAWRRADASPDTIASLFQAVQRQARSLHEQLGALPTGVVLP
ncbi:MAG: hypothetical protein CMH57_09505 [Myxococcales bacterium]|nr:hypothetical protein [Myxococcales bacterium]